MNTLFEQNTMIMIFIILIVSFVVFYTYNAYRNKNFLVKKAIKTNNSSNTIEIDKKELNTFLKEYTIISIIGFIIMLAIIFGVIAYSKAYL